MSDYPNNWQIISLSEAIFIQKGKKPFDLGVKSDVRNTPYINIAAFETGVIAEYAPEQNVPYCHPADTLLVWDGARAGLSGRGANGYIGSTLAKITSDIANPDYLFYFIQSKYHFLNTQTKGVGIPHINPTVLGNLEFPIPPQAEQTRIVEKLEELLTDLDTATTELKTAQKKLTQYRQSLLKAAVEGALTAEWRANNTPSESGSQLLERILKERRVRWEQKQLEKFKEQGKTPPKDWQKKYVEPVKPDTTGLMELPKGWVWACVEQVGEVQLGRQRSPDKMKGINPTKYIRAANITEQGINFNDVLEMDFSERERETFALKAGQILLTEASGSPEHVGRPVIWPNVDGLYCFQNTVIRFSPNGINSEYAFHVFHAWQKLGKFQKLSGGVGINHLSAGKFSTLSIPLPPLEEQLAIVDLLSTTFMLMKDQNSRIEHSLKQSAAQRKNILKAAFSGQLVPQDPNDEPASVLLERIKAERAEKEKTPKKANTRKVKEAST